MRDRVLLALLVGEMLAAVATYGGMFGLPVPWPLWLWPAAAGYHALAVYVWRRRARRAEVECGIWHRRAVVRGAVIAGLRRGADRG
jgi:hypothetical protein